MALTPCDNSQCSMWGGATLASSTGFLWNYFKRRSMVHSLSLGEKATVWDSSGSLTLTSNSTWIVTGKWGPGISHKIYSGASQCLYGLTSELWQNTKFITFSNLGLKCLTWVTWEESRAASASSHRQLLPNYPQHLRQGRKVLWPLLWTFSTNLFPFLWVMELWVSRLISNGESGFKLYTPNFFKEDFIV